MSTLDKINEALRNLDSDSPVAEALAAVVGTEKADSAIPLVDAAGYRMFEAFQGLNDGKSVDDVRPLLKSAATLLLVVSGDHTADYRTMSKGEFEEYAAGEIAKAAESGAEGASIEALKVAIDVASVLFKGENADRRFSLPLPIVAKAAEGGEGEEGEADEDADTNPAEGGEAAEGEASESAEEGEKPAEGEAAEGGEESASDDAEKSEESSDEDADKPEDEDADEDSEDAENVEKGWLKDMSITKSEDPLWGFDSASADAE